MEQTSFDVVIIGGGFSGLIAGIALSEKGLKTAVLEKNPRLGKKILVTGNGKCNLLSSLPPEGKYNSEKVLTVFESVDLETIKAFFNGTGLMLREDRGRIYPYSENAVTVLNALLSEAQRLNVHTFCNTEAVSVSGKRPFTVKTVSGAVYYADSVVLASGSVAGGGTDSLNLYAPYGHTVIPQKPSLVPFITDKTHIKGLKGVRMRAKAALITDGVLLKEVTDEIIFKDNGITGSAVFSLSSALARKKEAKNVALSLDLIPELTESELILKLKDMRNLYGVFHKEVVNNLEKRAGKPFGRETAAVYARLIKNYTVKDVSLSSPSLAQVMSGGLNTDEFDFNTMESLKIKGLYAVGEALDVDGECGGFNLMWAAASAFNFALKYSET